MSSDQTVRADVIFRSYLPFLGDGLRFVSSDEVKGASQEALLEIAKNGFQKLYERWQKCVIAQGDYLEGGCASVL
ncbi:hypothetical protein TNCV_579441 [Trichonephila clavipes]|nr:hypothetical protein TNCV_579441 [Trichonephila clavipes]